MKPYTYLIGWSKLNIFYYGVRYAKNCDPEELWKSYFTSSKHVKYFVEQNGNPDVIQIRKVFTSTDKARYWEHTVLRRLKVKDRNDFLNLTDNISIEPDACKRGQKKVDYKKVGESLKKFYQNADINYIEQIKENRRQGLINKSKESSIKQSEGIRIYQLNAWMNPEIKIKRSQSMKKPKSKIQCPHCDKIGGSGIMKRWHFDNCKSVNLIIGD